MKITAVKCAVIGDHPTIRIVTDEGIDGYGQAESYKPWLKPVVLHFEPYLLDQDPTDVQRVVDRVRRLGGTKPWGSAVSAIEIALWDLAGQAAGLPVHKMLGGKVRDRVRVYNGGVRQPLTSWDPAGYRQAAAYMKSAPEGFTIVKEGVAFHGAMAAQTPDFFYGDLRSGPPHPDGGLLTERGLDHVVACVEAIKDELGDGIGLALDCGPGWRISDAIRFARRVEHLNLLWLEDLLSGDYTPYTDAASYREVTRATSTPTHTGEQLYLRQGFRELIETDAVRVIGPDPADVGGLAELKWIAEYADLHGIGIAPHGVWDGLLGLAAHIQLAATLPDNFIAFEYPVPSHRWWYDIVDGLPDPIVVDGHIAVGDRPGLGVTIIPEAAKGYLRPEDADFFD
ncbi:mandelate racemase/muconate lactonizing enzyme family protein [Microlunatus soli]|uniref:L-alanine-DL-glutamate epimerase n=1 Tax=Microlunatus soli TaxID=630515 RepID=A0A1H1T839_9ACTN|nr:mandelate racemase/muconate lactonizing enzyme family protein [Microlunatus soli]SDS56382.1 L-alanine-DL-glutamate epimerase [Microlunatus soli]